MTTYLLHSSMVAAGLESANSVSALFEHLARTSSSNTNWHFHATLDSGELYSPKPLIINDLYRSVDDHNSFNCQQFDYHSEPISDTYDSCTLYLNNRSLPCKYIESETLISFAGKPDFIMLSETWLSDTNADLYGIQSYVHTHKVRAGKTGVVNQFSHIVDL